MGFLSNIKLKREVKKLESQLEGTPSAFIFKRLSAIYAENESDLQKAVNIAQQGLKKFPNDQEIKETYKKYFIVLEKQEIAKIEKKLQNFPSSTLFSKLAEKYFQIEDYDKAEAYAKTCVREYPERSGGYIILGRIYKMKQNYPDAVKMYEKTCILDRYNYDALMEYGEILERTNALSKALSIYKSVLFFAPADTRTLERINELRRRNVGEAPVPPGPETEMLARGDDSPFDIEFEEKEEQKPKEPITYSIKHKDQAVGTPQQQAAEAPVAAAPQEEQADRGKTASEEIVALLKELRGVQGVDGSILIDNYGLAIAEDMQNNYDTDLLAAVLTNMLRTIKQHAGSADLGDFQDGFVGTDKVSIHLYAIKDIELAIFTNVKVRLGLLEMKVKSFIEKFLKLEAEL